MKNESTTFSIEEKEALLELAMDNWGGRILRFLTLRCRDPELAKDLSQKLWVYVYRSFDPCDYGHIGFLENKARLLWIDHLRHQGRRPDLDFTDLPLEPESPCPEPRSAEEEQILFDLFWDQFSGLQITAPATGNLLASRTIRLHHPGSRSKARTCQIHHSRPS